MNYIIESHTAEQVILLTALPDFSIRAEIQTAIAHIKRLLHELPAPCCLILDIRQAHQSIDDVVVGANVLARGEAPLLHDPQIGCLVAVVDQPLLQFASRGLDSDIFGHIRVQVCSTLDAAWDAVRAESARAGS